MLSINSKLYRTPIGQRTNVVSYLTFFLRLNLAHRPVLSTSRRPFKADPANHNNPNDFTSSLSATLACISTSVTRIIYDKRILSVRPCTEDNHSHKIFYSDIELTLFLQSSCITQSRPSSSFLKKAIISLSKKDVLLWLFVPAKLTATSFLLCIGVLTSLSST